MRNPNAPWEIWNDAARKRWIERGRTRLGYRLHFRRSVGQWRITRWSVPRWLTPE